MEAPRSFWSSEMQGEEFMEAYNVVYEDGVRERMIRELGGIKDLEK